MEKFGWCFIGTGKLATQVAEQITKSGKHKIVSCYTRNYENAKAFGEKYGAIPFEDVISAINCDGVEGVYVVTTHNAHYRFVKTALENNKPVFCEKAFTVNAKEAEELIKLSKEKGLYLAEAMWTWFSPTANKVNELIRNGEIGNVSQANFTYHMKSIHYAPRVSDPKRAGGALLDITVYPITYAYRLFGMPIKIEAVGKVENGIDLCEDVTLTFEGGVKANISASIVDMKGFEKMKIYGDKGKITSLLYHCMNNAKIKKSGKRTQKLKLDGGGLISYVKEFDIVSDEIRQGLIESRYVPLKATLDVMRIMDEVRSQIGLDYSELE